MLQTAEKQHFNSACKSSYVHANFRNKF